MGKATSKKKKIGEKLDRWSNFQNTVSKGREPQSIMFANGGTAMIMCGCVSWLCAVVAARGVHGPHTTDRHTRAHTAPFAFVSTLQLNYSNPLERRGAHFVLPVGLPLCARCTVDITPTQDQTPCQPQGVHARRLKTPLRRKWVTRLPCTHAGFETCFAKGAGIP